MIKPITFKKLQQKGLHFLSCIRLFFYSSIQLFKLHPQVADFFTTAWGRYFFNAGILAFSLLEIGLAISRLKKARNRNWVTVGNFLAKTISNAFFTVAGIGALVAPVLFASFFVYVTASYVGFLLLQSLYRVFMHLHQARHADTQVNKKNHLHQVKENLKMVGGCVFVAILFGLIAAFTGTIAGWGLSIFLAAVGVTYVLAELCRRVIIPKIQAYRHKKHENADLPAAPTPDEAALAAAPLVSSTQTPLPFVWKESTGSVLILIKAHRHRIELELKRNKGYGEKQKREHKIQYLNDLKKLVKKEQPTLKEFRSLEKAAPRGTFQSFWKWHGEVEQLHKRAMVACLQQPMATATASL